MSEDIWKATPPEKLRSLAHSVSEVVARLMEGSEHWPDGEANELVWEAIPTLAMVRDCLRDVADELDGAGATRQDGDQQ